MKPGSKRTLPVRPDDRLLSSVLAMLGLGVALQQLLHRVACGNAFVHHAAYRARDRHLDRESARDAVDLARGIHAFRNVTQLAQHLGKWQALRKQEPNPAIAR